MESILALLLVVVVFIVYFMFLLKYPDWLEREKGCSPVAGGRIVMALIALFCVVLSSSADGVGQWLQIIIALALFVVVFLMNLKASGDVLQAFLMTLWQATAVVTVVIAILKTLEMFDRKKKK